MCRGRSFTLHPRRSHNHCQFTTNECSTANQIHDYIARTTPRRSRSPGIEAYPMKKFIVAVAAVAIVGLGSAPAHAVGPTPVDCADKPSPDIDDPCYDAAVYPPTTPASSVNPPDSTTTTSERVAPPTTLGPPNNLPQTGSGISSILAVGAALMLAGGLIIIGARRRSTSSAHA
jgi:LPXTG-motif cell wall-anchored protein